MLIFGESKVLSKNLTSITNIENAYGQLEFNNDDTFEKLHCFMTEKKIIECLCLKSSLYKVLIFEDNSDYYNNKSIILDNQIIYIRPFDEDFSHSFHCIHLKEEIGVFTYYIKDDIIGLPKLILQINELVKEGNEYQFKKILKEEKIYPTLDNNTLYDLNDINGNTLDAIHLMKINDNKFAYVYDYQKDEENYDIILILLYSMEVIINTNIKFSSSSSFV